MLSPERKILYTDGEGPLVFKDVARDVSRRKVTIEKNGDTLDGQTFFDLLSMFNAFIHERNLRLTQPGDTLAFLVPHLLTHNVSDEDLFDEAQDTILATGAQEYIAQLRTKNWKVKVISSAYSHLWETVGIKFEISDRDIASTHLNLDSIRCNYWSFEAEECTQDLEDYLLSKKQVIEHAQSEFRNGKPLGSIFIENEEMMEILNALENFYFKDLPATGYSPLNIVNVVGGTRKIEAMQKMAPGSVLKPQETVYIGDSITDDATLEHLWDHDGLPIAVNGDQYALRNARIAVATADMRRLIPILDAFAFGGVEGAISFAASSNHTIGKERTAVVESGAVIHVLTENQNMTEIIEIHDRFRKEIRGNSTPLI